MLESADYQSIKNLLKSEFDENHELAFLLLEGQEEEPMPDQELISLLCRRPNGFLRCMENGWNELLALLPQLHFDHEHLPALPTGLHRLASLESMVLQNSYLSALSDEIGSLQALQRLSLHYNPINELPPNIGQLKNLRELVLVGAGLEVLVPEIANLEQLEILSLIDNNLKELPRAMVQLQHLRKLILRGNHLERLPEELTSLSQLEVLDLGDNELSGLPIEINRWKNLKLLSLERNKISPKEQQRIAELLPHCNIFF